MKIRQLTLYTKKLSQQREFYSKVFGCEIIDETSSTFSVQIGHTKLTFKSSTTNFIYHYCFLIPSNKLHDSIKWLQERLDVISYENGRVIEPASKEWNADSVYFFDPTGNILEFIVRYDLKNESSENLFDSSQIIGVNEIGMPSKNLSGLNELLDEELGSKLWTGNLERFGANGTQEGLFLLVNYEIKKSWFPTDIVPFPSPFSGTFEINGIHHRLTFEDEEIRVGTSVEH